MAPPNRSKKPTQKGKSRHVSSFEEVMARNNKESGDEEGGKGGGKGGGYGAKGNDSSDESSEEEKPKEKPKKVAPAKDKDGDAAASSSKPRVQEEGIELSRKQREELEKENARRKYEELHKAGKTDEAKADLARLEAVKLRREEAAKKKAEELEIQKEKERSKQDKGGMGAEQKLALGGEAARMRGERSQNNKKSAEEKAEVKVKKGVPDLFGIYKSEGIAVAEKDTSERTKGSIQSCRDEEDDFM